VSALPNEDEAHAAFLAYAEAKRRVERTMDFADAMAAGRAWREFLNKFVGPENHMALDTNVVPFRKRGRG
jgi:hypothetical protein